MTEPYRIRSPATWAAAREAYLDGFSAPEVCARFDLGLPALRKRARKEGWRHADQPNPDAQTLADDGDLPDMDDQALAELVYRQMSAAARRGKVTQALSWARLRDMIQRQTQRRLDAAVAADAPLASATEHERPAPPAPSPPVPSVSRSMARQQSLAVVARARAELLRLQGLHDLHEVHSISPFEPGLDRTEHRRRLKAMKKQTGPP